MTFEQIDYMTKSGMLFLDKKRKKSHFGAANILKQAAFVPVVLFFVFINKDGTHKLGTLISVCTTMTAVFLVASYFMYKSQQNKLQLISFDTGISQIDNYVLTKKTIETLQWTMAQDTTNFIEAYNPHRDIRTWGNEMISLILLDKKILLNSICNLDGPMQAFAFGKNEENIEKFISCFHTNSAKMNSA